MTHAATFLQYASQPGPYFWGGVQATISPPASAFAAAKHGAGIQVTTAGTNNWTFTLDPPSGQQLVVGSYRVVTSNSASASLAIQGDGRECSFLDWADVTVLDLAFDASQNVVSFAADVKAVCDEYEPPFYAGIRFNSAVPYNAPSIDFTIPAFIQWVSQNGSSLISPPSGTYTRADGVFNTRTENGGAAGVHLWPFDSSRAMFDFEIKIPGGGQVVPGTYENARELAFNTTQPGIGIRNRANDCSSDYEGGRFVVYEIEYDPAGHVSKLAADFEEHCWPDTGGTFGGVRFNSTRAYTPPANVNALPSYLYVMDSPFYTVLRNTTIAGPRLQPVDGNRNAMAGVRVHFESPSCGSFGGAASVDVVSDSSGVAQMPPFQAANFSHTTCEVKVSIPATGVFQTPVDFRIYSESEVITTALPSQSIVVNAGQPITVGIRGALSDASLAGTQANFSVVPGTGNAAPASLGASAITNAQGEAYVAGVAGPYEGTYSIVATISGSSQTITVTQHGTPAPSSPQVKDVQDMWWGGPSENGWGMSLIEHNDTLFAALYIYDASGNPTWLVMPGGAWDSTHTIYAGSLYQPTGSPFYAYDTTHFAAGSAKGSITLTFADADNATLDYTIGTASGHKTISREIFGADTIVGTDRTDLWWGGTSQNGWGMTIIQQGATLFPIWYTYDASGSPMWYVMPSGTWTSSTTYGGALYRTTGSPWIGAIYDPSRLQAINAGTFSVTFNADGTATFSYTADGHSGTIPLVREPF